jgi:fucose permease
LLIGRLALRVPARDLLFGVLATSAIGWLISWPATTGWIAVAGLAVIGLGISGMYPLGMSLALRCVPGQGERGVSRISLGIGLSSGLLPFLVGALADATSTHTALVIVPALVALACLLLTLRNG